MNVLFLTITYPKNNRNIYSDLMQEFVQHGHNVFVISPSERRFAKRTEYSNENGVRVLRKWTLNLTKTNIVEKGLGTILIERQFISAIERYFDNVKFDLVLYSTPPITFERVIKFIKNRDNCFSYLLLKDIFPQNAVDLGMLSRGSLVWRYFRHKEKSLYNISDFIGCMSQANVKYLLQHNPEVSMDKVEECPNSIRPKKNQKESADTFKIRKKYNLPNNSLICLYGGNLGKPQGLDFLIDILRYCRKRDDVFFLIVGSGTEYARIDKYLSESKQQNAQLISFMPKEEYDELIKACDVGLIFLHPEFTIPNFPSRLTAYMEEGLPILAATDTNSDIKDVLAEGNCGMWGKNGDMDTFISNLNLLSANPDLRKSMGLSGRIYLERNYSVSRSYNIITSHLSDRTI